MSDAGSDADVSAGATGVSGGAYAEPGGTGTGHWQPLLLRAEERVGADGPARAGAPSGSEPLPGDMAGADRGCPDDTAVPVPVFASAQARAGSAALPMFVRAQCAPAEAQPEGSEAGGGTADGGGQPDAADADTPKTGPAEARPAGTSTPESKTADGATPVVGTISSESPAAEAAAARSPQATLTVAGAANAEVESVAAALVAEPSGPPRGPMVLLPSMLVDAPETPAVPDPRLRLAEAPKPRRGRRRRAPVPDPDAPPPPKRSRAHRVVRHTVRHGWRFVTLWTIASFAFVVAFAALAALALLDRAVTLPAWVSQRVETQINRGLPAGHISLDRVELELERGHTPQVRLKNVGLFDAGGAEVARLNEVGAGFDLSALVRGDLIPDTLRLSGAQVTVRRKRDGTLDLRFGDVGGAGTTGSPAGLLDGIDRLFTDGPLSEIEKIEASELTITLEDARTGRLWQVTDGRMEFGQSATEVEIAVGFDVFNGTEELASTSFTFRSDKGSPAAEIGASFANAAAGDIALQSPVLAFLGVLDAPIAGSLRLTVGGDAQLESFAGTLEIGAGALTPGEGAKPIRIDRGKAYFTFDPERRQIDFSDLSVESEALSVQLSGQTYLQDLGEDGWPNSYVGQFRLVNLVARAEEHLLEPLQFHDGLAELKLVLKPFELKIGKLRLRDGESTVWLSGGMRMTPAGAEMALDAEVDRIGSGRLLALWPAELIPKTRAWLDENLLAGTLRDARGAWRRVPGQADRTMLGVKFDAASIRFMKTMPPINAASGYLSLDGDRLVVRAEAGRVTAPEGGVLDIAGTVFAIPDVRQKPAWGDIAVVASGPIPAVLSLLDQEPFRVMQKSGRPVALAEGRAELTAKIALPLIAVIGNDDVTYSAQGSLTGVRSDRIVQGRQIAADILAVEADGQTLTIAGKASFGVLPVDVTWKQNIGPGQPGFGRLEGEVELSQAFMEEFGIDLPAGAVRGKGLAQVEIETGEGAPQFRLSSDLRGLALKIDSIVWRKPATAQGRLDLSGSLGTPPKIDRIALEGGGLTAAGSIALKADGQLAEARFDRVRLGGWLDAPVTLLGRGRGVQPGVRVNGGSLDFRRAAFGPDAGGSSGGPVSLRLDRLSVADGITLTGFNGEFSSRGGFNGRFTAKLNGGGLLNGSVAPQNGGTALRVVSDNAGDVLKDANLAQRVRGGAMELVLLPTGRTGIYEGSLTANKVRIRGTPALAELLNAVSIVGLLQQLNGDGLVFDQVEARFLLTPNAINFTRASGVGASLGLSAVGSYTLGSGALDIRGVFSPLYLVNGVGQIFGRKGEGLFGFNYRVQGTTEDPKVSVNPLSILTPGAFRQIFNAAPPAIK